jgi:hypothetical protein
MKAKKKKKEKYSGKGWRRDQGRSRPGKGGD